ncbi:MAG: outer membrane beta-barrel protein [Hyphomicrobiales bacterium]|nr:outer membrane beta-barrel protein [Hyphomicrobiales bacterium]
MTPMKHGAVTALSALALVASVSFAKAADVYEGGSIKDEPVYSTPYIGWTGFYVGGHLGGVFDESDILDEEEVFAGGFQLGYNRQLSERFVIGLEGDMSFLDDEEAEYLSSIRARLGWSNGPVLAYLTGGVGFLEFDDEDIDPGFAVGGGIDYKIQDNWSVGAEALYYNFEDPDDADEDFELWTARARLTYHIGGWR